jgi:hypothetical protein
VIDSLRRCKVRLGLPLALAACLSSAVSGPQLSGTGTPVLFIGNSLTYVNDLPGSCRRSPTPRAVPVSPWRRLAFPDYALIDHWNEGVAAGRARGEIAKAAGSSSCCNRTVLGRGQSRHAPPGDEAFRSGHLEDWGDAGAPLGVADDRSSPDFARAIESYTLAASDVNGVLLPVCDGVARRVATRLDARALFGWTASFSAGSYLSALVVYAALQRHTPVGLPSRMRLRSGCHALHRSESRSGASGGGSGSDRMVTLRETLAR